MPDIRSQIATLIHDNAAQEISAANVRNAINLAATEIVNVRHYGAIGDGTADDTVAIQAAVNTAYGTTGAPHGTSNIAQNRPLYFPAGNYRVTSPIAFRSVRGAKIYGDGRFSTTIVNTAGGSVFVTNGFEYSTVGSMQLVGSGSAVLFDLDWDNTGSTALQSNTFSDMIFEGGAYGLRIGNTGYMGSEGLVLNSFFANQTVAGLSTRNYNALQWSIIGGNFAGCTRGILVYTGAVPVITGVGFQNGTNYDIEIDNAVGDGYFIQGCRTESSNFIFCPVGSASLSIDACTQLNATAGDFVVSNAKSTMVVSSYSQNGRLSGNQYGEFRLAGNTFGRSDWYASAGALFFLGTRFPAPVNTALPVISGTAQVGQTLGCSTGTWIGHDIISSRTWYSNGVELVRDNTYVPVSGDIGHTITCVITATSYTGGSSFATAAATAVVIA